MIRVAATQLRLHSIKGSGALLELALVQLGVCGADTQPTRDKSCRATLRDARH